MNATLTAVRVEVVGVIVVKLLLKDASNETDAVEDNEREECYFGEERAQLFYGEFLLIAGKVLVRV